MSPTEICWETGYYTEECFCAYCEHRNECDALNYNDNNVYDEDDNNNEEEE